MGSGVWAVWVNTDDMLCISSIVLNRARSDVVIPIVRIINVIIISFRDFNMLSENTPVINARRAEREYVRNRAIVRIVDGISWSAFVFFDFEVSARPNNIIIINANSPPKKFGSSQVDTNLFMCGSHPSVSSSVKSG